MIKIYPDPDELARKVSDEFFGCLDRTTKEGRSFHIALSGGKTPQRIYEHLALHPEVHALLRPSVHFFWGDERCAPADHQESNFKMAYEAFLSQLDMSQEQIHRIRGEEPPEQEVRRYQKEIQSHVPMDRTGWPAFDWIFLGMGIDGHIASLFPGSEAIKEMQSLCLVVEHPGTESKRISLTLPVFNHAKHISFIVTGAAKACSAP